MYTNIPVELSSSRKPPDTLRPSPPGPEILKLVKELGGKKETKTRHRQIELERAVHWVYPKVH